MFSRSSQRPLGVLAMTAAFIGVLIEATGGQPLKPTTLPTGDPPATPAPEMTEGELGQLAADARAAWASHVPVVAGKTLALPECTIVDGLIMKAHFNVNVPEGMNPEPLELPVYLIVQDGEQASVSKATGEFQIGADHQETFQFLIDQLGRDKMQLIPTDFYEECWTLFRSDYKREDK